MSHHLDSPLARQDPRLNITDQYVFDDRDATVLIMNVRTSLAGAEKPLGFHDEGRYEFKVHLDDAETENLTFRLVFDAENGGTQQYRVYRLEGAEAADDSAAGVQIAQGRTSEAVDGVDGVRVWAGRVADPFFLDLRQLGAVDLLVQHGEDADVSAPQGAASTFAGSSVASIVLRIPWRDPQLSQDRRIRMWSTTKLGTDSGGWRQIGRAGLPMIWPIFRDADSDVASLANETHPAEDLSNYGKTVTGLIGDTVRRLGTAARPDAYAAEVARLIFPDTLPYRVGTPAAFAFTDFNGRHLGDNAPEVMFSLVTNSAVSTGLPPSSSAGTRTDTFPFVVPV
jgi:Domain of unknown function (DUF4331)